MLIHELFGIAGKVALVTGGSRGIGEMIAECYVRLGVKTYISARKAAACDATAARLAAFGECIAIPADLSSLDGIDFLARAIGDREERMDILVNNAGAVWAAELNGFPESGWDKVMNINVKSPFFLTQALLPLLEAAGRPEAPARVIMIGSVDGLNVSRLPTYSYGPSKAALHHLTRVLAAHLAERYVTVNALAPGLFPTTMTAATVASIGNEIRQRTPLGRFGQPSDVAGTATYLASPAASFVTGAVIPVDGGVTGARTTI